MNIYKQLISGLRVAKLLDKPDFEDFLVTASIKIAQTNDNVDKDALIKKSSKSGLSKTLATLRPLNNCL